MTHNTFDFDDSERLRCTKQATEILERLKQGPASNSELGKIAQRFGARLHELRKLGHVIVIIERDRVSGHVMYELRAK